MLQGGRKTPNSLGSKAVSFIAFLLIFSFVFIVYYVVSLLIVEAGYPSGNLVFLLDAALSLSMSTSVLIYLMVYKGMGIRDVVNSLGLNPRSFSKRVILISLMLFSIVMILSLSISLIGSITGTTVNTNVAQALSGAPLWLYAFNILIVPINGEMLFRGLMVPRIGIIASAIIFGLGHASYDSTFAIEVIAAMVFGLLAGYAFKKSKSLYPSIFAHMLVNALAILSIIG